jgi:uncharacterized protein
MRTVFADAVFYIALGNRRDQLHAASRSFALSYDGRIVTTEYVLLEVGNYLSSTNLRGDFWQLVEHLRQDANAQVIESSPVLWQRGLELYKARADKDWSLTDCISFVVMQDAGLSEALTSDRHFEQAGFSVLLK